MAITLVFQEASIAVHPEVVKSTTPLLAAVLAIAFPLPSLGLTEPTVHQIALNQIGSATGGSKRFTAPLSADGTPFTVRHPADKTILYQ